MPAERLAKHEKALVEAYVEARGAFGSPVDADAAWREYRGFAFQALMTSVVSMGLGAFTDSDDVIRAMLERSLAAVRRLRFDQWLDEVVGRASTTRHDAAPSRRGLGPWAAEAKENVR
jgi:hypothetical protein